MDWGRLRACIRSQTQYSLPSCNRTSRRSRVSSARDLKKSAVLFTTAPYSFAHKIVNHSHERLAHILLGEYTLNHINSRCTSQRERRLPLPAALFRPCRIFMAQKNGCLSPIRRVESELLRIVSFQHPLFHSLRFPAPGGFLPVSLGTRHACFVPVIDFISPPCRLPIDATARQHHFLIVSTRHLSTP